MSSWQAQDEKYIWHPFTPLHGMDAPLVIKKAQGVNLITENGDKIIDAISSWWVNIHGHSHPHIAEAVHRQAKELEHVIFAGFTHQPAIDLARRLLEILPENQSKVFYSDNGSTAVEVAIKMAFQFFHNQGKQRKRIVAIDGAYHGDTFGAMSVGERGPFTAPFNPHLFDVDFIDFPSQDKEQVVWKHFESLVSSGEVAAFIFEPLVQGASGMRMYSTELLDRMIALAQQNEVICIADEVMTGFGRLGTLFAADQLTNKPDIFCLSKGLTGGAMAMGVTTCTEQIQNAYRSSDLLKTFFHGHSFTANPIACAAANASLDLLLTDECTENRKRITRKHEEFFWRIEGHEMVRNPRVIGTIFAFDLNTERETSYLNEARHHLYPYFISKGLLMRPLGNVIYLIPPYIISDEDLEFIYSTILNFLDEYESMSFQSLD